GAGLVNVSPAGGPNFNPNTVVTITTTVASNSVFAGWAGACTGTGACQITMNANKSVTATFNLRTNNLSVISTGGTVSGTTSGGVGTPVPLVCQAACTWNYPFGQLTRVTLTATPPSGYFFRGWSGACTGLDTTCIASVDSDMTVTAVFAPILRVGAVFSSAQPSSRSFLRFYNTGASAGTAAVTLYNPTTGLSLGRWTTPIIPAGTAPQFSIDAIEAGLGFGPATVKPDYYAIAVETLMTGYFQHVLWRFTDSTFTNLSTCGTGITIDGTKLANVHSSKFDSTYPSSIVVNNTAQTPTDVLLGLYDAATNVRLGTMTVASVPARGRMILQVKQIEEAAGVTASDTIPHYLIKAEPQPVFTGFLEHLVDNLSAHVITDMTTVCSLTGDPETRIASTITPALIFSTAQTTSQSFLRLYNTGTTAGTATVWLYDSSTGQSLGEWTSESVPGGAEQQYAISQIEAALPAGAAKPAYYSISVEAKFSGFFQHVLWNSGNGTLTNLSTCAAGVTSDPMKLGGVYSSLLSNNYPSQVVINNTGSTALNGPLLSIYDARNGTKLGTYTAANIPPNGQVVVPVATIEAQNNLTPADGMYHYVIKADTPFTGFLQHLVNNLQVGVTTDMTTACGLRATGVFGS
ncbi:MAG: InlB B-repeat-containing protein, partial [Rhodospirillaceae bacterium]